MVDYLSREGVGAVRRTTPARLPLICERLRVLYRTGGVAWQVNRLDEGAERPPRRLVFFSSFGGVYDQIERNHRCMNLRFYLGTTAPTHTEIHRVGLIS